MGFLLYKDKTSIRKKFSRQVQGGKIDVFENSLGWWDREVLERDDFTDVTITITEVYHRNPSLFAHDFYGRDDLDWFVLQYNNIVDVNEEFITGKRITIPSRNRAFYSLLTNALPSSRVS